MAPSSNLDRGVWHHRSVADDLAGVPIADVMGESTEDNDPIEIDVGLFGAGSTEAIVADLDEASLAEDDQDEVDDGGAPARVADANSGVESIGGYRAEFHPSGGADEVFDSNDVVAQPDTDAGPQLIGGYRAEWRPSDGESDTFDPSDLPAGLDVSYGAGATDAQLHIADDVKYADDADPWGDGPHEVDIGGNLDEPTDFPIGPAEPGDDAVTEVFDTDAPLAGIGPAEPGDDAVTEVFDTDAPLAATDSSMFEDVD